MSPFGPAATTSLDGVTANCPIRGYCGRQLVGLRVVTQSGPAGTAAGMGARAGVELTLPVSDEAGVGIKVPDAVEADERERPPATRPGSIISAQSMGAELGE